jgi:hypothetical protein
VLDDNQRQELIARLEGLGETSTDEAAEPAENTEPDAVEAQDDRNETEPAPAEAQHVDDGQEDSGEGRQSGAQRRISELVRQRNSATTEFRELQEQYRELQARMQQMESAPEPQPQAEEQAYYDEYGQPVDYQNPDLMNLRAEFDQYREAQVIEQVKSQLESEIQEALNEHSGIDSSWLRKQLIDAVRLDGNADIAETAEYYAAFVRELQQTAAPQQDAPTQERTPRAAPPRLSGRSSASGTASQQGDKPFTREDARKRAYETILGR